MAKIDPTGVTPTTLEGYVTLLEETFQSALGVDLNLAPETPQGQLIGLLALAFTRADEAVVAVANGLSLYTASGRQFDDFASLMRVARIGGERSQVTVTLSGTNGTQIPAGSRARTTTGDVFALDEAVIIGATDATATMFSAEFGPIAAPADSLTEIVDVVPGWTGVTNAAAAQLGRLAESDREYRRRYFQELAHAARDSVEAIRTTVLRVEGVSRCRVIENATTAAVTTQNVAVAARSILIIVHGGADAEIGAAILRSKPAGVPTVGTTSVDVPHAQGQTTTIKFTRVATVALKVKVSTVLHADFPANGIPLMRQRVAAWAVGTLELAPGTFDRSGLDIGEALDQHRLLTPINSVPGHTVSSLTVTQQDDSALPTVDAHTLFTIAEEDVDISIPS